MIETKLSDIKKKRHELAINVGHKNPQVILERKRSRSLLKIWRKPKNGSGIYGP